MELGADVQEPGHGVSTMNRSSALDIKSPLERGGPLAVGSVLFEARFKLYSFWIIRIT